MNAYVYEIALTVFPLTIVCNTVCLFCCNCFPLGSSVAAAEKWSAILPYTLTHSGVRRDEILQFEKVLYNIISFLYLCFDESIQAQC